MWLSFTFCKKGLTTVPLSLGCGEDGVQPSYPIPTSSALCRSLRERQHHLTPTWLYLSLPHLQESKHQSPTCDPPTEAHPKHPLPTPGNVPSIPEAHLPACLPALV